MSSLTHVCIWSENKWKRITADEAAKKLSGTVSAHLRLFMCELCGQYVILTGGDKREPYFKHNKSETNKDCPERTFGSAPPLTYNNQEHDLPIRITNVSSSSFSFEIGLIRAPTCFFNNDFRIEIKPKGVTDTGYIFTDEHINFNKITFLPIGERPFEKYTLSYKNANKELSEFWPCEIDGIDPQGTLFEKSSGIKLSYDADVEIEKKYYLLLQDECPFSKANSGIDILMIGQKIFASERWTLYEISASTFSEDVARFFLDFHCRLTDRPLSLKLVWPPFIEGKYLIKHNQNSMYMLVEGNVSTVNTFPNATINELRNNPKVYEIRCTDLQQQLISVGRTHALEYTYFWREPLTKIYSQPEVTVTDISGNIIESGETHILPKNKTLGFKSLYYAEIIVSDEIGSIYKYDLPAEKYKDITTISYGLTIKVIIGLDVIWKINFRKKIPVNTIDEVNYLKYLTSASEVLIPAPHSLNNILIKMNGYPLICNWIRKCIKNGTISEKSYRRLQDFYRNLNIK